MSNKKKEVVIEKRYESQKMYTSTIKKVRDYSDQTGIPMIKIIDEAVNEKLDKLVKSKKR